MKRYLTFTVCFVLMAMLTSCIVFREVRALTKHAPGIRDGRLFAHDTIANDARMCFVLQSYHWTNESWIRLHSLSIIMESP